MLKLALLAVSALLFIGSSRGQVMRRDYERIEGHLVRRLQDDDAAQNMLEAEAWLQKLKKGSGSKLNCFKPVNPAFIEALEEFVELKKVLDPAYACSSEAFRILWTNDYAAGKASVGYTDPDKLTKRVARIVFHYDSKHTEVCKELYPDLLAETIKTLGSRIEGFVQRLGNKHWVAEMGAEGYETNVDFIFMIHDEMKPMVSLVEQANFRKKRQIVTKELFREFVVGPCRELDRAISEDLRARTNEQGRRMNCSSSGRREPYKTNCNNRGSVNFCHFVVTNEDSVWNIIEETMENQKSREEEEKMSRVKAKERRRREEAKRRQQDARELRRQRESDGNVLLYFGAATAGC